MKKLRIIVGGEDELSSVEVHWLKLAKLASYENPFVNAPTTALIELERRGFIERNPSTLAEFTEWRITERGERVKLPK